MRADELAGDERRRAAACAAGCSSPARSSRRGARRSGCRGPSASRGRAGRESRPCPFCSSKWQGSRKPGTKSMCCAVEREALQPVVAPIGDDEDRRCAARVDPDAVRLGQLARLRSLAAERADVLRLAVVLVDVVRAVAVADVDVAVGRDRDVGRVVALRRAVGRRACRRRCRAAPGSSRRSPPSASS